MWKLSLVFAIVFLSYAALGVPQHSRVARQADSAPAEEVNNDLEEQPLGLPSNSTSIRANIVDTFDCTGKVYGYYADVDNDCQVFHVCLPQTFADGSEKMFKWSFICGEDTIFNQESLTCARAEDAVPCQEAPALYSLNDNFGKIPEKSAEPETAPAS